MASQPDPSLAFPFRRSEGFRERHPGDAIFFPAVVGVIWLIMLMGFVPEVIDRIANEAPPYPMIIHLHAVIFFGWLVFLALQVALVRSGKLTFHRRLGVVGASLAVAVVIVGPAAALTMQIHGLAKQPPQFLAIQLLSVAAFAACIASGLLHRRQPAAHKRLMLIGTLAITGAGFGRIIRLVTGAAPPWTFVPAVYIGADCLMLAMAIYDYRTRGRLHPIFAPAAGGFLLLQIIAGQLLHSPSGLIPTFDARV